MILRLSTPGSDNCLCMTPALYGDLTGPSFRSGGVSEPKEKKEGGGTGAG